MYKMALDIDNTCAIAYYGLGIIYDDDELYEEAIECYKNAIENDNKYENYLPNNTIFTEIEEEDYIDLISEKIEEEQLLEKYCISKKKLHLH